jgi:hypothetical protein
MKANYEDSSDTILIVFLPPSLPLCNYIQLRLAFPCLRN